MSLRPAVFFDRDGVVNVPPPVEVRYLRRWEDFQFMEGIQEVLRQVKASGLPTFLITNQQGVGKGLMALDELEAVHQTMQSALGQAAFDGIYAATGLSGEDSRRKPSPAMLLEAAEEHRIDLGRSWMIGDHDNDMRAAVAAGAGTIRMRGLKAIGVPSDHLAEDAAGLGRILAGLL